MALKPSAQLNVVLVAHGASKRQRADNAALVDLTHRINDRSDHASVGVGFLVAPEELEQLLQDQNALPVLVLPLMFSRGYFLEQKLGPIVQKVRRGRSNIGLDDPLIEWPQFIGVLKQRIAGRDGMIVAHGSTRSDASRLAASGLVKALMTRNGQQLKVGFLEEPPFASDEASSMPQDAIIAGLFMAEGMHGNTDFNDVVSRAPKAVDSFAIGRLPELDDIILDRIDAHLDDMRHRVGRNIRD